MAYSFDTLGYAKRLRDAGVAPDEAEAHAEAARDFIMTELVTKQDLDVRLRVFEGEMRQLDLCVNHRIDGVENRLGTRIDGLENRLGTRIDGLENRLGTLELRLMLRMGSMLAVAVAILAALIKL